jgi:uncharacterized protein (TIGR00369 family)
MTENANTIAPLSVEWLQEWIAGKQPDPPIIELIGIRGVSAEVGKVTLKLQARPEHANPMGTMHGGVLCDLADAAMGMAFRSTLQPDETFTTLELKINFMRPVWNDLLLAHGRVVKAGRTIGLVDCNVVTEAGDLVAYVTSTVMVLRGDKAKGR